jgi:hypothetical protein
MLHEIVGIFRNIERVSVAMFRNVYRVSRDI